MRMSRQKLKDVLLGVVQGEFSLKLKTRFDAQVRPGESRAPAKQAGTPHLSNVGNLEQP